MVDFDLPEDLVSHLAESDEHTYRHDRRHRIAEGAEEIRMRRVAGYLFGFVSQQAPKGVASTDG